jgi:hypothetical protein
MRRPGDIWTKKEAAALRKMATAGISRTEAARRLGRHASTVSKHILLMELEWKPPPREPRAVKPLLGPAPRPWSEKDDLRLTQLAAEGVPIGLAANRIGRAYNTVLKHAKRLGLKFERDRFAKLRHRGGR